MYLQQQYYFYDFANYLIHHENFELAHLNTKKSEIWLVKTRWRTTKIVRLLQRTFDWGNHLKNDIAKLFQQVRHLRKQLGTKHIEIYNVYISELEPVDDWEQLKAPLQLKEKNPLKMKVFYMTEENRKKEQERLLKALQAQSTYTLEERSLEEKERAVEAYRYSLGQSIYEKNRRFRAIFTYGKPRMTYILLYINIIIFLFVELSGGSMNPETLIQFGAKYNPAIVEGEWWRILTSMFLHIGFAHLAMNMLALYFLGTIVERIYGSFRFTYIYILAGILGGLTSFAFNPSIAAGASGAIFGLFGSLLFFGTVYPDLFKQTMGVNVILILLINMIFGLMVPQIDLGAHLGGLVGGYVASAIVFVPQKQNRILQLSALVLYFIGVLSLGYYGIMVNLPLMKDMYIF